MDTAKYLLHLLLCSDWIAQVEWVPGQYLRRKRKVKRQYLNINFFFFFRWRYSPLWALACRTIPLHFFGQGKTQKVHKAAIYWWTKPNTSTSAWIKKKNLCFQMFWECRTAIWTQQQSTTQRQVGSLWVSNQGLMRFTHLLNSVNPLNPELNTICYLLALLAHYFLHVSRIRVKSLTIRLLMSYIYGAPILDVSRSHTTMQHSR